MASVRVNKRLLWLMGFLLLAVPVVVGVLVWHFTKTSTSQQALQDAVPSGNTTTNEGLGSTPPVSTTPTPEEIARKPWLSLRLPAYQIPLHYDIVLYPDFYEEQSAFYGNETVDVEIRQDTKYILIHVFDKLQVESVGLRDARTNATLEMETNFYFEDNEFLVVESKQLVSAGSVVQLVLQFRGLLNESIVGFYKSSYVNSLTNETRHLATSKFEPVSARRAFPCMDEPALKAEFSVTLIHQPDYIALSNMPPAGPPVPAEGYPGLMATKFQRSVNMSTYLVCFIVCDFEYTKNFTSRGTEVRVYATPDKVNQTMYALRVAVSSLEEYERLFNISYPLPKQDLIAIPDFVSGAMEHWGLITFREVNLLYDQSKTSEAGKQRVAVVVAHEVSHQWFGNLVTMAWWNDLWLNEGFATFMEYVGAEALEKDWEMTQQFITEESQPVMVTDAGVSSHPIVVNVYKPDEINEVFDAISYSKGAAVIRMLEAIIGKEKFFEGVSRYLKSHAWGNAATDDLWKALSEIDGAPNVKHIMDTWTLQMGFPLVSLSFESSPNHNITVTARQARFVADPGQKANNNDSPFGYRWYIDLECLTSSGNTLHNVLDLENASFGLNVDTSDNASWVKCNRGQTGFYRVNYPPYMWSRLAGLLRNSPEGQWPLGAADRSGLIDDAMNLARAGLLSYDAALEMTSYLYKEESYEPWASTWTSLSYISSMLSFDKDFALWRKFVLSIVVPSLSRLGWDDVGSHNQRMLRAGLIELACTHGDPRCLANATSRFRTWLDQGVEPAVNLKKQVYKYGVWASGNADDWDNLWERYKVEIVPQEKTTLLSALATTKTPWLISRLLDYAKEGVFIRRQDFIVVVQLVAANPAARNILWDWVEEFFRNYPDAGAGARGRKQALDRIQQNIHWMTNFKPVVAQWLQQRAQ